ncbi:MAG: hypothetical protein EOP22_08585 [Hyphomicrobiales bacterium]|nr:MAG: hypothetical protein EOP22_08585 [Hyphomicrobiales bacterium]
MSRPESAHVTALKSFRDRLVDARRAAVLETNLDTARQRFAEIQSALALVERAIENELDLTPLPTVDDPTAPEPQV